MAAEEEHDVDSYGKHPALRNFSRFGFMAKYTLKKALMFGAIGAVAGIGALAAGVFMGATATGIYGVAAVVLAHVPIIGDWIKAGGKEIFSTITTGAGYAAAGGGILGAVAGLVVGLSGAGAAADAEEDRLVAKFEQQQARRERLQALERRRDEQKLAMERQGMQMPGPGMQLPYGKGRQGGQGVAHNT